MRVGLYSYIGNEQLGHDAFRTSESERGICEAIKEFEHQQQRWPNGFYAEANKNYVATQENKCAILWSTG
jgi:hypothetical protein